MDHAHSALLASMQLLAALSAAIVLLAVSQKHRAEIALLAPRAQAP